jgi:hypothetical protein
MESMKLAVGGVKHLQKQKAGKAKRLPSLGKGRGNLGGK